MFAFFHPQNSARRLRPDYDNRARRECVNQFAPFLRQLGSARRSPTTGSSDIVSPNPIDRVSDKAPEGPDLAPRAQM